MTFCEKVPFVMWYNGCDLTNAPQLAIVQRTRFDGARDIALQGGSKHGHVKFGVRHIEDQFFLDRPDRQQHTGGWDYCDSDKLSFQLKIENEEIRKELAALKAEVADSKKPSQVAQRPMTPKGANS